MRPCGNGYKNSNRVRALDSAFKLSLEFNALTLQASRETSKKGQALNSKPCIKRRIQSLTL